MAIGGRGKVLCPTNCIWQQSWLRIQVFNNAILMFARWQQLNFSVTIKRYRFSSFPFTHGSFDCHSAIKRINNTDHPRPIRVFNTRSRYCPTHFIPCQVALLTVYQSRRPFCASRMEATWFVSQWWGKRVFYLPRYISIILSWSTYSKMWGASIKIPTVPAVVTIKNMYNWSLSITIATYFQSSLVCKITVLFFRTYIYLTIFYWQFLCSLDVTYNE